MYLWFHAITEMNSFNILLDDVLPFCDFLNALEMSCLRASSLTSKALSESSITVVCMYNDLVYAELRSMNDLCFLHSALIFSLVS